MSFYDDASLIMYPSGYKADKIYSLKPTDGSGDFDFARASTATRVNSSGLIETVATGIPRIDYTGGGCGKLLLEGQRTNLVTYSSEFDNAAWITFRSSVTANATTSPDGTQNAEKIIQQLSTTDSGGVYQDLSLSNSTVYTYSVYLKEAGYDFGLVRVDGTQYAWFDLATGVVGSITGSGSSSIQNMGNGWYRCIFTFTTTSTLGQLHIYVAQTNGSSIVSSADGVKGIFAYGAQLEQGSYPTSYIPTAGSQVTRVQDATTITDLQGKGVYPSLSEGTFFLDLKVNGKRDAAGSYRHIRLVNNSDSTSNRIRIYEGNNGVTSFIRADLTGGVIEQDFSADTQNKLAVTWGSEGTKIYKNGVLEQTTAIQLSFTSTQKVLTNVLSNYNFNQILMFPAALSNSEAITLTTI